MAQVSGSGTESDPWVIRNYYFENQGGFLANVNIKFPNKQNSDNDGQNWQTLAFRLSGAAHQSTGIQDLGNHVPQGVNGGNMGNWLSGGEPFRFEYGAGAAMFGFWALNSPKLTGWCRYGGTQCFSLELHGFAANVDDCSPQIA